MEYLKIGLVVKAHGVRGVLRVYPLTSDINRFCRLKKTYMEQNGRFLEKQVTSVSLQGNMVNLKLNGIDDRDSAETLRQTYLYVKREDAVKLPKDSYFISDLIGCKVQDDTGLVYGEVEEVLETGANDVYVVKGEKEWLMPAIKQLVMKVDVAKKCITVSSKAVPEVVPDAD